MLLLLLFFTRNRAAVLRLATVDVWYNALSPERYGLIRSDHGKVSSVWISVRNSLNLFPHDTGDSFRKCWINISLHSVSAALLSELLNQHLTYWPIRIQNPTALWWETGLVLKAHWLRCVWRRGQSLDSRCERMTVMLILVILRCLATEAPYWQRSVNWEWFSVDIITSTWNICLLKAGFWL